MNLIILFCLIGAAFALPDPLKSSDERILKSLPKLSGFRDDNIYDIARRRLHKRSPEESADENTESDVVYDFDLENDTQTGNESTSTESSCGFLHFFDALISRANCQSQAQIRFDENLSKTDFSNEAIEQALCNMISEELDCVGSSVTECSTGSEIEHAKLDVVGRMMRKAMNVTFLGEPFINSCPPLFLNQPLFMTRVAGSDVCTFAQYESSFTTLNECVDRAENDIENMYNLLNAGVFGDATSAFVRMQCDYRNKRYHDCPAQTIGNCVGGDQWRSIVERLAAVEGERESLIAENSLPDFSYSSLCPPPEHPLFDLSTDEKVSTTEPTTTPAEVVYEDFLV